MNAVPGANGSRPAESVGRLREQIAEDRRALAETISALHDKTDVKKQMRDKAATVEIAAADAVARIGRTASSIPHLAKNAARGAQQQVSDQAQKVPEPVRAPFGSAVALLRGRLGAVIAAWAAITALVVAMRRWRGR